MLRAAIDATLVGQVSLVMVVGEAIREYVSTRPGDALKAEMGEGASRCLKAAQTSIEIAAASTRSCWAPNRGL